MNAITKEVVKATFEKYFKFKNENVFLDDAGDAGFVVTGQVNGFGSIQLAWMDNEWRYTFDLPNGGYETLDNIFEDLGGISPRNYVGHITIKTLTNE